MTEKTAPSASPKCVVVVDDSPLALRLVKHALAQLGDYLVLCAAGAPQARDLLLRHKVDLAIVDIVMPHESGFDLARWLRSQPKFAQLPILFFTADAVSETVREAASFGRMDYLLKPLKPSLLRDKVERLLATEPARETTCADGPASIA